MFCSHLLIHNFIATDTYEYVLVPMDLTLYIYQDVTGSETIVSKFLRFSDP